MNIDTRLSSIEKVAASLSQRSSSAAQTLTIPDVMEFAESDRYLNRRGLYPRQATMLKLMFLQEEILTDYDRMVIDEWAVEFRKTRRNGIQADIWERFRIAKEQGRPHFREVLAVIGRRGGKNHVGSIAGAYKTWMMLALGDPQQHFGLDPGQVLSMLIFAGNEQQARAMQFASIVRMIESAPCFRPFLSGPHKGGRLALFTPHDLEKLSQTERGKQSDHHRSATIEILAKPSTLIAGRGPTAYAILCDEMAHMTASGASRSAEEIHTAAIPSLDQFQEHGFIFEASSPWHSTGQFFENYERSIGVDSNGHPIHPEKLMFQLTSFCPYIDWERAHRIPTRPAGVPFSRKNRAIQTFDEEMAREKATDPQRFRVEREAQFAAVADAFLDEDDIRAMFGPWRGEELLMQTRGALNREYVAHADPGLKKSNFAFAIAHLEIEEGIPHVVFDVLEAWKPIDFGGTIDYFQIEGYLRDYLRAFMPSQLTFDQWNSAAFISNLQAWLRNMELPKNVWIEERNATQSLNRDLTQTFRAALAQRRIHAPSLDADGRSSPVAELSFKELSFLQLRNGKVAHPTSGPVQTDDLADVTMGCVLALLEESNFSAVGDAFRSVQMGASPGRIESFDGLPSKETAALFEPFYASRRPRGRN